MVQEYRVQPSEGEMLAVLAHDLRSPLTAIRGAAALLLQAHGELADEKLEELLRVIETQADRMADKVEDVLAVRRLEQGTLRLSPERLELADIVADALDVMRERHRDRRFRVAGVVEGLYVTADAERAPQALRALLDSAAQQAPGERPVEIRASRQEGRVRVEVRHRGGAAEAVSAPLGLPLAQGLCLAMGGEAGFESRSGAGVYWLVLPASK